MEKLNCGKKNTKSLVPVSAVSSTEQFPEIGFSVPINSGQINDFTKGKTSLQLADLLPIQTQVGDKGEELPDCKEKDPVEATKIQRDFSLQLNKANKNLIRLQYEFGKLQNLSMELDHNPIDFKDMQDSMETMNRRIDGIAKNQQEFVALLLKMSISAKKQDKADKLILDSLSTTLAKLDVQMEQIITNKQPPEWAIDMTKYIHDMGNENREMAMKMWIAIIANFIVCLIVSLWQ